MREIFLSREKERKEKKFGWSKTGFRPKREREREEEKKEERRRTRSLFVSQLLFM